MTNKKKQKSFKMIWNFFCWIFFHVPTFFKVVTFKKHIKEMVTQVSLQKKNPFPAIKFGKKIVRLWVQIMKLMKQCKISVPIELRKKNPLLSKYVVMDGN